MFAKASAPVMTCQQLDWRIQSVALTVLKERGAELVDRLGKTDAETRHDLPA